MPKMQKATKINTILILLANLQDVKRLLVDLNRHIAALPDGDRKEVMLSLFDEIYSKLTLDK